MCRTFPKNSAVLIAAIATVAGPVALAQTPAPERKVSAITRVTQAPTIDGRLDEPVWQTASVISDLTQFQPVADAPPGERSEFRLLYDSENLYIAARLWDSDPTSIVRRELVQDAIMYSDDHIQIYVDPRDTRRGGYIFFMNPNGVQRDGLVLGSFQRGGFNMNWDGIWQGRASVDESGWSVEMAIPFSTLDFDPAQSNWGINFVRRIARTRESVAWMHRDRNVPVDSYGRVDGLRDLSQGLGLDVTPSVTLSDQRDLSQGSSDQSLEPSVDVFYRVTPSLTAALTVNTDFSATEVDDRQVNLTRFSLFFPEKRDFFLQNADIFEFGNLAANGRPFFSRTIGLSSSGQPADITAGAKLAGNVGRWNLGVLGVHQDEFGDVDAETLFVGRVSANVFDESRVGAILTRGDPNSNIDNTLMGVDYHYRNTQLSDGRSFEGRAWYQSSDTTGLEGEDSAYGANIMLPNDSINAGLGFFEIQKNFNPAMGFVNRTEIRAYEGHLRKRWRFDSGMFRYFQTRIGATYITDLDGSLETASFNLIPAAFETQSGEIISLETIRQKEVLSSPFEIFNGVVIPTGKYEFSRHRLTFGSSDVRPISVNLALEGGEFFDGRRFDTIVGVDWKPSRRFVADLSYAQNRVSLTDGSFTTKIWSLKTSIAFSVRWAWINTFQHDNVSNRLGINSRLRFTPRLGQEAFLVLNHDFLTDQPGERLDSTFNSLTLKFSYNFRF